MPSSLIDIAIAAFLDAKRRTMGQFVRFAAVGAFNTVLDFGVYVALTRGIPGWSERYVAAATVSFLVAVASSFLLNTFWTFRSDLNLWHRRAPKFLIVAAGGLAWNAFIIHTLTVMGAHDIIAKLVATGLVLFWNFTLQKKWTFRA